MPKKRKGPKPYEPPLEILLRDASPTTDSEIAREQDPRRRDRLIRDRDRARIILMRMHRTGVYPDRLSELRVRRFCAAFIKHRPEQVSAARKAKTGRPDESHDHLLLVLAIEEEIRRLRRGKRRGFVEKVLIEFGVRLGGGIEDKYDTVRKIYYRYHKPGSQENREFRMSWAIRHARPKK